MLQYNTALTDRQTDIDKQIDFRRTHRQTDKDRQRGLSCALYRQMVVYG